jgi:hypothetical protein
MRERRPLNSFVNQVTAFVQIGCYAHECCDHLLAVDKDHANPVIVQTLQCFELIQRHGSTMLQAAIEGSGRVVADGELGKKMASVSVWPVIRELSNLDDQLSPFRTLLSPYPGGLERDRL